MGTVHNQDHLIKIQRVTDPQDEKLQENDMLEACKAVGGENLGVYEP